jgi:hypothetical protein
VVEDSIAVDDIDQVHFAELLTDHELRTGRLGGTSRHLAEPLGGLEACEPRVGESVLEQREGRAAPAAEVQHSSDRHALVPRDVSHALYSLSLVVLRGLSRKAKSTGQLLGVPITDFGEAGG